MLCPALPRRFARFRMVFLTPCRISAAPELLPGHNGSTLHGHLSGAISTSFNIETCFNLCTKALDR